MFPLLKYSEAEVEAYISSVTPEMVSESLAKERHGWFDLLNLISAAAYPFMDETRAKARRARIRYYGKTVSVYAPLYIGNTCVNHCKYCDFRREHTGTVRRNLTLDEIRAEADAIRASGIDNLLIVAGEDPKVNSVEHFCAVAHLLKPMFSNLSLEVAPQAEEGYRELFAAVLRAFRKATTATSTEKCIRRGQRRTMIGGLAPSSGQDAQILESLAARSCWGWGLGGAKRRASPRMPST